MSVVSILVILATVVAILLAGALYCHFMAGAEDKLEKGPASNMVPNNV
jgi:hypothetical protein